MNGRILSIGMALGCVFGPVKASDPELISRAAPGTAASTAAAASMGGIYSADANLVIFSSAADDLVNLPGTSNFELFLWNRAEDSVQALSRGMAGPADGGSFVGSVTADSRSLVFFSSASNLTEGDPNQSNDIFLRDLETGHTTLISTNSAGFAANGGSQYPEISADGKWIVFESYATDLTGNDQNLRLDLFARRSSDGSIHRISAGPAGESLETETDQFQISGDGRFVMFTASGQNLLAPNQASFGEIYLHDLEAGTNRWISSAFTNVPSLNGAWASAGAMSADGRFVFAIAERTPPALTALTRISLSDNSVTIITNQFVASASAPDSYGPVASDDGQFAAFSDGANVFLWSAASGQIQRVDVGGSDYPRISDTPVISHDGTKVAFLSDAQDLVPGRGNGEMQLYLRDMVAGTTKLITRRAGGGETSNNEIWDLEFSLDDTRLLFSAQSADLIQNDRNDAFDVFEYSLATDSVDLISRSRALGSIITAFGSSNLRQNSFSADGRLVAFETTAKLNEKDTNGLSDIYLYDRVSKTMRLVSAAPDGYTRLGYSRAAQISSDGRKIAFESNATGLANPNDGYLTKTIYVYDVAAGTNQNIIHSELLDLALGAISANGEVVLFITYSTNAIRVLSEPLERWSPIPNRLGGATSLSPDGTLVGIASNGTNYIWDYLKGSLTIIDKAVSPITVSSFTPLFSADNNVIVYQQGFTLVTTNRLTGVTDHFDLPQIASLVLSADARIIAYKVRPSKGGDEIGFVDRLSGENVLISRGIDTTTNGNGNSTSPVISANGRFIAFESWASNLVPNDTNNYKDIFLYDRLSGKLTLASHISGSSQVGNSLSLNPAISADGTTLGFLSFSSDLIAGDVNELADVFALAIDQSLPAPDDSDSDGLDDGWEFANFSSLRFGPEDDLDEDGANALTEFQARTDPLDKASALTIKSVEQVTDSSRQVRWNSVNGLRYQLEFTAAVRDPNWVSVGPETTSTGAESSATDNSASGSGFYRVRLVH